MINLNRIAIYLPLLWAALTLSHFAVAADDEKPGALRQIAPDVYAVIGRPEEAAPSNQGIVGNYGVIIGKDGVILIDTGTSARYMENFLQELQRITDKPVVLAINTHQAPAFVFGNGTLASRSVPILAHKEVDALIGQRCARCLKLLLGALGEEAMAGTSVVRPTMVINDGSEMLVGGRLIDILYYGQTSSKGSVAVYDRESGVLFGGGIISIDRIPDAKDGDIPQWRAALRKMRDLKPRVVVPGEGPVVDVERLESLDRYLQALDQATKDAYEKGFSLTEAPAAADVPAFRSWALYDVFHRKNVEQLYLRQEQKQLAK